MVSVALLLLAFLLVLAVTTTEYTNCTACCEFEICCPVDVEELTVTFGSGCGLLSDGEMVLTYNGSLFQWEGEEDFTSGTPFTPYYHVSVILECSAEADLDFFASIIVTHYNQFGAAICSYGWRGYSGNPIECPPTGVIDFDYSADFTDGSYPPYPDGLCCDGDCSPPSVQAEPPCDPLAFTVTE